MGKAVLHRAECFPPVIGAAAHTLILGSSPGPESLARGQYYARAGNGFWPILGQLFDAPAATYAQRLAIIRKNGLALWDVLAECERHGALDSRIVAGSKKANDIAGLLKKHKGITRICFNGGTAESDFFRLVAPTLEADLLRRLTFLRLPSTSSAYAAMRPAQKAKKWSLIKG